MKVLFLHILVVLHMRGSSFVSPFVPSYEISALEDLFEATGGYDSLWKWRETTYFGELWNFSINDQNAYVHNPCSNNTWQGISCSSSPNICSDPDLNQSCSITKINLFNYNLVGSLPSSISLLNHLQEMVFWNNHLTSTLPHTLSLLTNLKILDFYDNKLSGNMESVLPLSGLKELYLSYNFFSGKLQPELEHFTQIEMLYLNDNILSGSLITALGQLRSVEFLDLNFNSFTGTLIPELGDLSSLQRLYLNNNPLSGPLTSSLGRLTQLERLDLFFCQLTGSLIPELGQMIQMSKLDLSSNFLTGPILPSLGDLVLLMNLNLFFNELKGSIPSDLSRLTRLERLRLENNHLEGSIPSFIGNFTHLTFLSLGNNAFTGPLISVSLLKSLKRLLLQDNHLSGEVTESLFFSNMSLDVLDLSHNRLSGTVPSFIFKFPHITTIALSLNCFHGTLPIEMCAANELLVLAMDGLGVARDCKDEQRLPFTRVVWGNTLEGTIPMCLWSLPHIELLHLSGNGLTGKISSSIPHNSTLKDLSLAHNKISGTLPVSLASLHFTELDLSFNRLSGKYKQMNVTGSVVTLEVNRLSGPLPEAPAFALVHELAILRDNLFGCESLPREDSYSEDFSCGSQYLDIASYVFLGVVAPPLCCLLLLLLLNKCLSISMQDMLYVKKVHDWFTLQHSRLHMFNPQVYSSLHTVELVKIYKLQRNLRSIALKFILILGLMGLVSFPIYALKVWEYGDEGDARFSTHTYTYGWVLSVAYVTGNAPALFLLFGWISVFGFCYFLFSQSSTEVKIFPSLCGQGPSSRGDSCHSVDDRWSRNTQDSAVLVGSSRSSSSGAGTDTVNTSQEEDVDSPESVPMYLYIVCFVGNVALVSCVNILYVISTFQPMTPIEHLLIQVCVAAFKIVYNTIILNKLITWLTVTHESNIRMQLILSIFNKIFIPCLVTACASPSCFQSFFVEPDDIMSAYTYEFCSVVSVSPDGSQGSCLQYTVQEVDVIPMTPPIIYNYMCSSVLLATYIPVYMFVFSFQILGLVMVLVIVSGIDDFSRVWVPWRKITHGIFWTGHWCKYGKRDATRVCAAGVMTSTSTHTGTSTVASTVPCVEDAKDQQNASRSGCAHFATATTDSLFKSVSFQLSIMNHLMILLTFGFCSPFLALVLLASLLTEISLTMVLISRFVEQRLGSTDLTQAVEVAKEANDHALVTLSRVKFRTTRVFHLCLWPMLMSSSLFFAVISWDMTTDASGWLRGCWAPLLSISTLVLAKTSLLSYNYHQMSPTRGQHDDSGSATGSGNSSGGGGGRQDESVAMVSLQLHTMRSSDALEVQQQVQK